MNAEKGNGCFLIHTATIHLFLIASFVLYPSEILIINTIHLIISQFDYDLLEISFCLADLVQLEHFVLELAYKIFQTLYRNSSVINLRIQE